MPRKSGIRPSGGQNGQISVKITCTQVPRCTCTGSAISYVYSHPDCEGPIHPWTLMVGLQWWTEIFTWSVRKLNSLCGQITQWVDTKRLSSQNWHNASTNSCAFITGRSRVQFRRTPTEYQTNSEQLRYLNSDCFVSEKTTLQGSAEISWYCDITRFLEVYWCIATWDTIWPL